MLRNWKLTCWLASPLCGDPPKIDSILEWELSKRLGLKKGHKVTRSTPLADLERVSLPIAKRTFFGYNVYATSDPIIPNAPEWTEYQSLRIDTSMISQMLSPDQRKNIFKSSGAYKMRHVPQRIRSVDKVVWFLRCDKSEVARLLCNVFSLGKDRAVGYGIVSMWTWDEMVEDYSIFVAANGRIVLNKTLPLGDESHLVGVSGYRKGFGGGCSPYWHPETQMEIAIPC